MTLPFVLLLLLRLSLPASSFGSMGPIAASFGSGSFFCALDAGGQQTPICWSSNATSSSSSINFTVVPSLSALSGGQSFMCGLSSNTSQPFCWDSSSSGTNLVPPSLRPLSFSRISAGLTHVCALRGSYFSPSDPGPVDCWDISPSPNHAALTFTSEQSTLFSPEQSNTLFSDLVSGDGFSCGTLKDGNLYCWGPNSSSLEIPKPSEGFASLTSGRNSVCGILKDSGEVKCFGDPDTYKNLPIGVPFVSLTASDHHFCGIRHDTHEIQCWGRFNSSAVPRTSGFFAIASSDAVTCGIREIDLVLDCWFYDPSTVPPDYDPPLQLCSPGLCQSGSCGPDSFAFNASTLNEPGLTSLCAKKDLAICSPCASNCPKGFFLSSSCTANSDRVCTDCSLCQNSSCWEVCGIRDMMMQRKHQRQMRRFLIILGPSIAGFLLIVIGWCLFPYLFFFKGKQGPKKQFRSCIGKHDTEGSDANIDLNPPVISPPCPGEAQIFRLSELKDATNGFKEFNELGRGSYGFVYKAVLTDGKQVAVKRANAATIINTNIREFEMELEILCKLRHSNIVNLLGYCTEMGERLLVYEYMPYGNLHDHLHGGLSPLNWSLRLKIAMQAAKGLEYLHNEPIPPIVHRDVKSSNVLLDSDWGARVSDFGCSSLSDKDLIEDMKGDVYSFGIVLLEILSGRKAYDIDYTPASIVEWAVPIIRKGKAAAIIDRYVALPRNVEPLLRLADMAEVAVRERSDKRPTMSEMAHSLEQIVREGLIL